MIFNNFGNVYIGFACRDDVQLQIKKIYVFYGCRKICLLSTV